MWSYKYCQIHNNIVKKIKFKTMWRTGRHFKVVTQRINTTFSAVMFGTQLLYYPLLGFLFWIAQIKALIFLYRMTFWFTSILVSYFFPNPWHHPISKVIFPLFFIIEIYDMSHISSIMFLLFFDSDVDTLKPNVTQH